MPAPNRHRPTRALAACLLLLIAAAPAATASDASSGFTVLVEGGAVAPRGDLAAGYAADGYEAGLGFEAGARVRRVVAPGWDASLAFVFARFGTYDGVDGEAAFESRTSAYRYGLDLRRVFGAEDGLQLFATGGVALVRNRYSHEVVDTESISSHGQNSVVLNLGGGVTVGSVEVTAQYHRNRFETRRFLGDESQRNWDHVSLRIGLKLPESF